MTPSSWSSTPSSSRRQTGLDLRLATPAHLAVGAVILWLAGVVVHALAFLVPIAIVLLIASGVAYLVRPKPQTMYWRGRQLDLAPEPGPVQQLYRLFFKR